MIFSDLHHELASGHDSHRSGIKIEEGWLKNLNQTPGHYSQAGQSSNIGRCGGLKSIGIFRATFDGGRAMAYEEYRKSMLESYYSGQLTSFVSQFDPKRKTIFLLPGGMASQLVKSDQAYPTQDPNFFDYQAWLGLQTFSPGNARYLQIGKDLADDGQFVVGSHGPICFIGLTPYDKLIWRAKDNWNLFIFAFDWRRSIDESAEYFMSFIRNFRDQVRQEFEYDPLPDVTLLSHSMGGLVLAYALHDPDFSALPIKQYMAIAANFYGWPAHQIKYYMGQPIFNDTWGVGKVTHLIGSLPGGYSLMTMPTAIFARVGGKLGLKDYPVRDKKTNVARDPYDPAWGSRWPRWVQQDYLQKNIATLTRITDPFDNAVASRFFSVRSTLNDSTPVGLLWEDICGSNYSPGSDDPITKVNGKGDGVIPYWSAFHAETPDKNWRCLKHAKDHVFLLEHSEVLDLIEYFVEKGRLPVRQAARRPAGPKVATFADTKKALRSALDARQNGRKVGGKILQSDFKRGVLRGVMS
jgi:pimeloyl-ACP methyl ester carboxylesterase